MTTKNPRLNITLDKDNLGLLGLLAKSRKKSLSAIAKDFILRGMDMDEDLYFLKIIEERDTKDSVWISHKDAWK